MDDSLQTPASALDEWRRLQGQLVQKERALADLAVLHARGEVTVGQLDGVRRQVELLRDFSRSAFEKVLADLQRED